MIFETKEEKKDYYFLYTLCKARKNRDERIIGILKTAENSSSAAAHRILELYNREVLIVSIKRMWKDDSEIAEISINE